MQLHWGSDLSAVGNIRAIQIIWADAFSSAFVKTFASMVSGGQN